MRKNTAYPTTAIAVLFKFERTLENLEPRRPRDGFDLYASAGIELLAIKLGEARLGVERVHRTDTSIHKQLHDAFDFCRVMDAAV